jgi:hypothetical protein
MNLVFVLVLATLVKVQSECANACNGHGKCTSFDMCICNRNYQGSDCSERICQFGIAHVDTPKGDIDGSGAITDADHIVIENNAAYPYGTSEQFPNMQNSDLIEVSESAHYYMECSNKGICDRTTGECECYPGYDGVSCQRASCPGFPDSCNGHGVCKTIAQLAYADNENVYKLWDQSSTMGCECDAGFYGPDCSLKKCKYGSDPLYLDDTATTKRAAFDFLVLTTFNFTSDGVPGLVTDAALKDVFNDGEMNSQDGHWRIRFFDHFGEDWTTEALIDDASCEDVIKALEAIPNDVVPAGTTYCSRFQIKGQKSTTLGEQTYGLWEDAKWNSLYDGLSPHVRYNKIKFLSYEQVTGDGEGFPSDSFNIWSQLNSYTTGSNPLKYLVSGFAYNIIFDGIAGYLAEPKIELYTDGKRPSLVSSKSDNPHQGGKVITKVFTDGMQGEDNDYFADHCDGVTVTVTAGSRILAGMTPRELNLLKACLGDSDFDIENNDDIYNWDHGDDEYPHIVKFVKTQTSSSDGGMYVVLVWNTAGPGHFEMINNFKQPDWESTLTADLFDVYTTTGTLARVSNQSEVIFSFADNVLYSVNSSNIGHEAGKDPLYGTYDGDVSCEVGDHNSGKFNYIAHCLNKSDIITFLNFGGLSGAARGDNPENINLYTVMNLAKKPFMYEARDIYNSKPSVSGLGPADPARSTVMAPSNFMTNQITLDLSTNWASINPELESRFSIYKFFPGVTSTYNYVAECSNRGTCDDTTGICKCFSGYTGDACEAQSLVSC